MNFQDTIIKLDRYWARQGCALLPPGAAGADFSGPVCLAGAGRRAPGPDGLEGLYRYRLILRPAPSGARRAFLDSLKAAGIDRSEHDLRWLPFDGDAGAGWEVLLDGRTFARFTYLPEEVAVSRPAAAEITISLESLALVSQRKRSAEELAWSGRLTYGELHRGEGQ